MNQPKPEGSKFLGPPVDQFGRVQKYDLKVGRAESLLAMTGEYTFFTPAVLYLHAGFTDAPLADAMWELREQIRFYHRKFDRAVFAGLEAGDGNADWNHVLWAVGNDHWPFLHDFVASLTLSCAETRTLCRVGARRLTVFDPLAVDRQRLLLRTTPVLEVTAFGVNGNRERLGVVPAVNPFMGLPRLVRLPPADDVRVFAEAYYGGKNPINARQNFINERDRGASGESRT